MGHDLTPSESSRAEGATSPLPSPDTDQGMGEPLLVCQHRDYKPPSAGGSSVRSVLFDPTQAEKIIGSTPDFGLKFRMDHQFPETWDHVVRPRLRQIPDLLPMALRYFFWRIFMWFKGREPFIDMFTLKGQQIYGVPLGGIGAGSIGRGFKGQFCRFQMTPGLYEYKTVFADQFIVSVRDGSGERLYQKVLTGAGDPGTLSAWDWTFRPEDGSYLGLYPRAWYTYTIPEENLVLTCKQISPVIPKNYKDSSMPASVFIWSIYNGGTDSKHVSITFTFKTGTGVKQDRNGKASSVSFEAPVHGVKVHGVALEHQIQGIPTTYGIACLEKPGVRVTHMVSFDLTHGSDIWYKLSKNGGLDTESGSYEISRGDLGSAVNSAGLVPPNASLEVVFALVWHQPVVQFRGKAHSFTRRYARFVDRVSATADVSKTTAEVQSLLGYALSQFSIWDKAIDVWQEPILRDPELPSWFKSAIFNELYFVSDGGTVWFEFERILDTSLPDGKYAAEDVRTECGRFGYLEGQEYRMYNTYDVHFYSSVALSMLWPKLQLSLMYDCADTVPFEDPRVRIHLFDGRRAPRKVKDSVPHDIGDPWEDPFSKINSYLIHDVSEWRDLNLKFVLQVYRDFRATGDRVFLRDMLPACTTVMKKSMAWDTDGDGLIENSGSADQTYDSWIMNGVSAYCGGLWLASLFAMIEMLKEEACEMEPDRRKSDIEVYETILAKGRKSFQDKLWNGSYYEFDSSEAMKGKSIMSDQLCGHWFLAMAGLDDSSVFPPSNVAQALQTIYQKNVQGFCGGEMGAVNGMNPDGTIDTYAIQSEETWTGVTYALAATMIHQGMTEEGFKTAEGIYRTVYERTGLGFQTPEALIHSKRYRALGYMRPLSIWAMLHAWNQRKTPTTTTPL